MILVVDDHRDTAEAVTQMLRKRGRDAAIAESGRAALSMLRSLTPDLIVLDMHMPELDGTDVLGAIRENDAVRHVPVIVYSADASADAMMVSQELGAREYVVKGQFDMAKLGDLIDKHANTDALPTRKEAL